MAHAQTKAAPTFPNGTSALNETFEDWQVSCRIEGDKKVCLLSQQQRKKDTNQLVLAAEFNSVSADGVKGTLVLPFGLKLSDGVTFQIDDAPASRPVPFGTCLPVGCIVPLGFDAQVAKALRGAKSLKLNAKSFDGEQDIRLSISLKGFAAAQDRIVTLQKP